MKALLNEHLNILRIANIQSEKREWEEFLQSLYEFHLNKFSEDQLLTEGFLDKVKDTFKKATDDSKKYLKYSFNSFKKNNEKPSEFVKDIGDAFQGSNIKSSKDLKTILKLSRINSLSKGLNEVDEKSVEISSVEEMEKLKPGQKFVWKGKDDRSFPASNFKNLPDGLISGEEYIQAFDEINNEWLVSNTKEAARVENSKDYESGGVIQKLGDFFRKNKWLTAAMVAPVLASATVGGNAEAMGQLVKAITGSDINIDNSGVLQTGSNPNSMGDDDGDGVTKAGGGDDAKVQTQKIDLGTDGSIDDQDMQKFGNNLKKLTPDEDTDKISTAATYKVGEYKLDQTVKKAVVEKGVKDVLKQIEKQVAEKGVSKTIIVKGEVKGHISSNAGNEDNVANDGSDLAKGRASTGEEINKEIQDQVTKIVKAKLGVDVKFDTKSIADSDIEGQVQHKAVDNTADQSTTIKYKADTDGGKKIGSIKNWQPVVAVTGKGGSDMGQRVDIPGGSGSGKSSERGTEKTATASGEVPKSVGDSTPEQAKYLKKQNLNRNQEIFSVLKMANPNIKGDPSDRSYKSWDDNVKKVVINLRKSPDTLLKKFQSVTGINLSNRQKATGLFKRSGVAEMSLMEMVNEAAIDKTLELISVTDDAIKKNKVEIMAMLMDMYKLNYTDIPAEELKKLTPQEQKELKSITQELEDKITQQQSPDVKAVNKDIESNSTLKTALSRINTYDEFEALILGMAALVNPNLAKQKTNIKAALFSLSNKIKAMKEENKTPSDTEGVYKIIDTLKLLKSRLEAINNKQEFEELIFSLLPYIDPKGTITKDKNRLSSAIISASNRNSLKDDKPIDLDKLGK
jgi:hypothetical protein